jgi:hypothetical protein
MGMHIVNMNIIALVAVTSLGTTQSTIIHEYKRHVAEELTLLARKHVVTLIYCINSTMPSP